MSSTAPTLEATAPVATPSKLQAHRTPAKSIGLVLVCTIIGAAAQILLRMGADYIGSEEGLAGLISNWPLMAGYVCLGANTLLLVIALREGQLSVLYPIIALTYVWVAILSPMFFDDTLNAFKIVGIIFVVGGVSMIGAGSKR